MLTLDALTRFVTGSCDSNSDRRWSAGTGDRLPWFGTPAATPPDAQTDLNAAEPAPAGPELWSKVLRQTNRRPSPQIAAAGLTPRELEAALAMSDLSADGYLWAKAATIAQAAGCCVRVVHSMRSKLRSSNWLVKVTHGAGRVIPGKRRAGGAVVALTVPGGPDGGRNTLALLRRLDRARQHTTSNESRPSAERILELDPHLERSIAAALHVAPATGGALRVARTILARAPRGVRNWPAYIAGAARRDRRLREVYLAGPLTTQEVVGTGLAMLAQSKRLQT